LANPCNHQGRAQVGLNRAGDSPESAKQLKKSRRREPGHPGSPRYSHALRPAELDQLGLASAIKWMVEKTAATSTTRFGCEVDGLIGSRPK